jgi:hypothetical protein
VTREQLIVIGFLAAAFVAGWVARALIGRRDRRSSERPPPVVVLEEQLERAVEATRQELDRAIRSHVAAVALSVRARDAGKAEPNPLAEEVSAALQDDAANDCMLSVMDGRRGAALSERELDLTDWGFAYGVAWTRARERGPGEPGDAVAHEALKVAETVFGAYVAEADWALEGDEPGSAGEGNGNGRPRWPRPRP